MQRLRSVSTGCPYPVRVEHLISVHKKTIAHEIERAVHERLCSLGKQQNLEWFRISPGEAHLNIAKVAMTILRDKYGLKKEDGVHFMVDCGWAEYEANDLWEDYLP